LLFIRIYTIIMSDAEKHHTCAVNYSPQPSYCLENCGDFLEVAKQTNPKNTYITTSHSRTKYEWDYSGANERRNCNIRLTPKGEFGLYEDILREIRNMNVLTPYQLHYLKGASNEQLFQIIEIYNLVVRNVNEIL
jgi:hypothetical protein